ncbi:MAG: hypothetical protein J7K40_03610 [candidate division Zixibacteria bacterium]|nr:hypothetical protein [candidate division Zixibacteria bacterium]
MFAQSKQLMVLAVVFVVLAYLPVSATIINVPADYDTIQAAINASSDGNTVLVAEGHYFERINTSMAKVFFSQASLC